ncbi:N-acetyltransferase family protein [Streptomyces sp. NPDC001002]
MTAPDAGAGPASALRVRPLGQAGDRERLKGLCPRLSAQSRYMRFHGALNELSGAFLDQLMNIDHHDREALIVLARDEIAGIARYSVTTEAPHLAEVSVLVADAWQHQGIAQHLMAALTDAALHRGVLHFKASVLPSNERARQLLTAVAPDHRLHHAADGLEFLWQLAPGVPLPTQG